MLNSSRAALVGLAAFASAVGACTSGYAQGTVPTGAAPNLQALVHLRVYLDRPASPYKPIYNWFGYDEANFTTMRDGKRLLGELHDLSPVPVYIRAHHLLTSGDGTAELKWSSTGVYREDGNGKPVYDFHILDGIFDEYKAAGVRPMVELGFMPRDLAAAGRDPHQPYQVHFPGSVTSGSSNNPPKDYAKWRDLVRAVTGHLIERYGRDTVLGWYFEVWNEPDIDYWHGSAEDYWKLYDYAVAGVREALPGAKVGGPASTGPGSEKAAAFLQGFLRHVQEGKSAANGGPVPLDFISFHVKGHPTITDGTVQMGLRNELNDAAQGFSIVSSYPRFRELPIILSEADPEGCAACSSRMNPANNYRNGTLYPAYTAAAYKALLALQERYKVHLLSMLSWSFEFENRDYFEGLRSLSTNGVDKPVLNLFRMLGLMQGARVSATSDGEVPLDSILSGGVRDRADTDVFATAEGRESSVLAWSYSDVAGARPAAPVTLSVSGLPAGTHRALVTEYRIDEDHSNAYTVWKAMGSPQHPTAEQYAQLQARAGLELVGSPRWVDVVDGTLTLESVMPGESVSLFQVRW